MQNKLVGWGAIGAAVIAGALYLGGVIGPGPEPVSVTVPPAADPGATYDVQATEPVAEVVPTSSDAAETAEAQTPGHAAEPAAAMSETTPASPETSGDVAASSGETSGAGVTGAVARIEEDVSDDAPVRTTGPEAEPATASSGEASEPETAGPETETAAVRKAGRDSAVATFTPPETSDEQPPDPVAERLAPPRFDVVRAEPGGLVIVAGIAAPEAQVAVLLDDAPQPWETADASGRFAAFLDIPPTGSPRVLRLRMRLDGYEIESEEEVILAPPPPPEQVASTPDAPEVRPEAATAAPGTGSAPGETAASVTDLASADGAPAETPKPQAPTVLLSTDAGVEVMQPSQPLAQTGVAIDAISYDDEGGVALAGRGTGTSSSVRIYLDNRPITTSRIAADGRWSAVLPGVDTGTYTLRVDQIDEAGEVTARAESPFLREDPERLAAVAEEAQTSALPVSAVTIQPGHTLWAIARGRYGEGMAYLRIYEANKSQIRDPDLIYPGQVFDLPE